MYEALIKTLLVSFAPPLPFYVSVSFILASAPVPDICTMRLVSLPSASISLQICIHAVQNTPTATPNSYLVTRIVLSHNHESLTCPGRTLISLPIPRLDVYDVHYADVVLSTYYVLCVIDCTGQHLRLCMQSPMTRVNE
jgi:hypothetical protein